MKQAILPPEMEPFRPQVEQSRCSFIRVEPLAEGASQPWKSKIGGLAYQPKGHQWPVSPDGNPLFFLGQINFAELPALHPFPEKGILQFFINDDDLYGMDFDQGEVADTFRVVFHPDPIEDASQLDASAYSPESYDLLPHQPEDSFPLAFHLDSEVVPVTDYRFWETFGQDFFQQFGAAEWEVLDTYSKLVKPQGHKVGGYAYFTQDDPRKPEDPMLLLFQLDSDQHMNLMWGDMGVGHFFVRESDLAKRDFSRVLYDWDCL